VAQTLLQARLNSSTCKATSQAWSGSMLALLACTMTPCGIWHKAWAFRPIHCLVGSTHMPCVAAPAVALYWPSDGDLLSGIKQTLQANPLRAHHQGLLHPALAAQAASCCTPAQPVQQQLLVMHKLPESPARPPCCCQHTQRKQLQLLQACGAPRACCWC
jgi:hypothetical protein